MTTSATVGVLQMSQMFHPARWYLSATWSAALPLPWNLSTTRNGRFIVAITETSVRSGTSARATRTTPPPQSAKNRRPTSKTAPGKSSRLQLCNFVPKFGRLHRATYWSNQDLAGWGRGQLPA